MAVAEKPITKKQERETERLAACAYLRKILRPGDIVYTVLRHASASGMSRRIDLYTFGKDGPRYLTGYVATAAEYSRHSSGQITTYSVSDVVYNLGRALWPKGFKLPKGAPGRNGDTSGFDTDGGYALKHEIL